MSNNDRIDKQAILAEMDKLADELGDWKDHLPYEAAIEYYVSQEVRDLYSDHMDSCRYCQEAVSIFNPDVHLK